MTSFRDLRVDQKLKTLRLEVHRQSLDFPKFEMYELGSQKAGVDRAKVQGKR